MTAFGTIQGRMVALLSAVTCGSSALAFQPPNHVNGSDCARCHVSSTPSPGSAQLQPCSRLEALRQAKKFETLNGPRLVLLDELENVYLPVPFDHAGHAGMAQMGAGCVTCHHYSPEGASHPACKTCHEAAAIKNDIAKPGLKGAYHRQCMSCHREWSGETGCSACHQPKTAGGVARNELPTPDDLVGRMHPPIPEPEKELYVTNYPEGSKTSVLFRHREHILQYQLRCAECHRDDNCSRCHQQGRKHVQKVRTVADHHSPCISCHQRDTCDSCHFAESVSAPPPFDHSTTGWALKPYHASRGCRACHPTVPFEKRDTSCDACHRNWDSGSFNHAVTGQVLNEKHAGQDCANCHKGNSLGKPPTCDECHDQGEGISFPAKRPGPTVDLAGDQH